MASYEDACRKALDDLDESLKLFQDEHGVERMPATQHLRNLAPLCRGNIPTDLQRQVNWLEDFIKRRELTQEIVDSI